MARETVETTTCDICTENIPADAPRYSLSRNIPWRGHDGKPTPLLDGRSRIIDVCESCGDNALGLSAVAQLRP